MDLTELVDLPVLPLRIEARARETVELPANAGSSFRGAFGAALKELVCARPDLPVCDPCPLLASCAYPALFEPRAPAAQPGTTGFEDLPRPYVFRPAGTHGAIPRGQPLGWEVTLIGRAVEHLPYFVLAWRAMGERGIGRGRGRFDVERVEAFDLDGRATETLYDGRSGLLRPAHAPVTAADLDAWWTRAAATDADAGLTVRFLTPTLLKHQGQPALAPEFHILWRSLQRRLSLLRLAHGAGRPQVDFAAAIAAAEAVRLTGWRTTELSWSRYSRRQGQRVPMRGFIGKARYEGELSPFLPALLLGTLVGVGDNCTFGQGRYAVGP